MGWLIKLRKRWFPTLEERALRALETYSPCTTTLNAMYEYERWLLDHGYLKTRPAKNGQVWLEKAHPNISA